MSDLIEREAALSCFHDWIDKHGDVCCAEDMQEYRAIESLPSAQPEIIYCRDCKHWRDDHTCREHSLVSPMKANEFCSRAERREE